MSDHSDVSFALASQPIFVHSAACLAVGG